MSALKLLHTEWQIAFSEWHLHRTDSCAEVEKTTRINYLNLVREMQQARIESRRECTH
jgi:uncharacterized membrane protein